MELMTIGKGECLIEGKDLAILSVGPIGKLASQAIKELKEEGISVALYNMRFVKPLDEELLHSICKKFTKIITIENGVVKGGFGSAVLEFCSENHYTPDLRRLGLPDDFVEQGSIKELQHFVGIDQESIEKTVKEILAN